ncbi:DUF397 domain-containing protein [Actinoplanes sp. NPDC023801]|uniref:DUF397 domain-containing protein n=1 Tax=Actinoplanes sp. NPDC023801 TaxID=3154595 RepID=UPI0033DBD9E2
MQISTEELAAADWKKSSFSGPNCDNCVEVASVGQAFAVRDSKNPAGGTLFFTGDEFAAFLEGAKHGEFDKI